MTVNVTKSSFNVREKLKELERPIGVKGNELMRAETAQEAGALLGVGRRNLCINGNFKIWQRGTSIAGGASGNTSNAYKYVTADRWQTYFYNTYARQDSVLPNGERVYSLRETFNVTRNFFVHIIEDGGRIFNQGDYITISFWAKTSGPSTGVSLGFYWYDGSNWSSYTYTNIRNNVIIEGSEWKYYTATTQIPANAANRQHLAIEFDNSSGYGPLFGGSWTQLSGTDYWEFANIQIEKGKVATEFEYRSYGEELALCQRYYTKMTVEGGGQRPFQGTVENSGKARFDFPTPTQMRTKPDISNSGTFTIQPNNSQTLGTLAVRSGNAAPFVTFESAGMSGLSPGDACQIRFSTTSDFIALDAEI